MSKVKNYFYLFALLFAGVITINYSGCASAESTTGKLAYKNADYVKAEKELSKGLMVDKNDAEGWFMLGHSQIELGKFEEAKTSFKKSLEISPNFGNDILNLWVTKYNSGINSFNSGLNSLKNSDSAGAVRNFRNALLGFRASASIIPDSVSSFQMIADSYFYLEENDSALMVYSSILDKTASKEDAIQIARILYETGIKSRQAEKYEEAETIFNKVLTIPFLPKDNEYYEIACYNIAYANYSIATKKVQEDPDFDYKPYMNKIISVLEPVANSSKNNELLADIYDMLIVAYDALDMDEKKTEAETRNKFEI
jgi:Flp pilus assembly protein TadD, contains TPR repeats